MVKITFIESSGEAHTIEAKTGQTVMEAAVKNSVPGIAADCGGNCACGTCRVYLDETWSGRLSTITEYAMSEDEEAMIEFAEDQTPNARLSCQLSVTDELDGLIVHMPESQH